MYKNLVPEETKQAVWDGIFKAIFDSPFYEPYSWNELQGISPAVAATYNNFSKYPQRTDPFTLDLDGDGIETVGVNAANPLLFDIDAVGIKKSVGWVKADDGLLALDRNNNGTIDSGAELFGDATPIVDANGNLIRQAADGFDALAQQDSNLDGVIDGLDTHWANLRVWQDTNQDGISQSAELKTLAQLDITALHLAKVENSLSLANGNVLADLGSYTRADGTQGGAGTTAQLADIDLAVDSFHSQFADSIPLSVEAQTLPDIQGSGQVRSLREAASLPTSEGAALAALLSQYSQATSQAAQLALLDPLLKAWSDTSPMAATFTGAYTGHSLTVDMQTWYTGLVAGTPGYQAMADKLTIMERFNGRTFQPVPEGIDPITITLWHNAQDMLNLSYEALRTSVHDSLALQTRLKPYLDQIQLAIDDSGIRLDFAQVKANFMAQIYADPANGFADLKDFNRSTGELLAGSGWKGADVIFDYVDTYPITPEVQAVMTASGIRVKGMPGWSNSGSAQDDVMFGDGLNDFLYGYGGSDELLGGAGNDLLDGGAGDDLLDGGQGDDTLNGGDGSDTVDGGAGDDIITDQGSGTNVLRGGDGNDTVKFSGEGVATTNTVDGDAGDDLLQMNVIANGNGNTQINLLTGGTGNDRLVSGSSLDTYRFNRGDGRDTINDYDVYNFGRTDTLALGAGIVASDLFLSRSGYNLVIKVNDPGNEAATDQVTIENWFLSGQYQIETLSFADGTSLSKAQLTAMGNVVYGTEGADTLTGWSDSGTILGLGGNDTITDNNGSDTLDGGAGDDIITDQGSGTNVLRGGDGNDTVKFSGEGVATTNTVDGDAGDDLLQMNVIANGNGNTQINLLTGGTGNDRLVSGSSLDTYRFNRGDGRDTINDYDVYNFGRTDTLALGAGIVASDLFLSRSGYNLVIKVNDPGNEAATDQVTIENWFLSGQYQIETLSFADGTSLSKAQLSQPSAFIYGTDGADALTGTVDNNVIIGGNGNDILDGGTGIDTLIGGIGDDTYLVDSVGDVVTEIASQGMDTVQSSVTYSLGSNAENLTLTGMSAINGTGNILDNVLIGNSASNALTGGAGNDTYKFAIGGGTDTIVDSNGIDQLVFGTGILASGVTASRTGSQVKLSVSATDSVTFDETAPGQYAVESVVFADGTVWQAADVRQMVNSAPTGDLSIGGTAAQNQTLAAVSSLADVDGIGAIGYQWQSSSDGTTWSNISGATASSFTLGEAQVGQQVRVNASYVDAHGTSESVVSETTAAIANVNDAPTGTIAVIGTVAQNETLVATNTLADADGLGLINYQWQQLNIDLWADIGGATESSFTLTEAQVGHQVRAMTRYVDGHNAIEMIASEATDVVANVNDLPTGAVTLTGMAVQNQTLIADNNLVDIEGWGSIGYQWESSIDGSTWNAINGATANSFALTEAQVGQQVRAVASYTDGHGTVESVASTATTAIANVNDAPTGTVGVSGTAAQGQTLPAGNTLADIDGLGAIGYQWQSSADGATWNNISGATASSLTLIEAQVGQQVRAVASYTDTHGTAESVASTATMAVANVNDAPTGTVGVDGTAAQGQTLTASNTLADVDGIGSIGYQWQSSTDGTTWNAIAGATASNFTLSEAQVGQQVRAIASYTDSHGTAESVASTATVAIANVNDAPTVGTVIPSTQAIEDSAFQFIIPSGAFRDADVGDTLAYSATLANGISLPAWLTFDAATGTFSGTPLNEDVGALSVSVIATDTAGAAASQMFTLDVANTNDTPEASETIAAVAATEDSAYAFTVPTTAFRDVDIGDTLTLSASQANGDPLPAWLSFDTATGSFSGTPLNEDVGFLSVTVVATDAAGAAATQTFTLDVANTNDAPIVGAGITAAQAIEDNAFQFIVPEGAFSDVDAGDSLSYTASLANGNPLPAWLSFDPATRMFSGTPANADVGTVAVSLTVTDAAGASVVQVFDLDVINTNDAPLTANDFGAVVEDLTPSVAGNVLENDSDPDVGDVLGVADSGLRSGSYGQLALEANGDWSYQLDTAAAQALGAGETAVEQFAYTAFDGQVATPGTLSITVGGSNDAPLLAAPLTVAQTTTDTLFSWNLPAGVFVDPDANDILGYSARLVDGSPLPAWLSIDAATGALAGTPGAGDAGELSLQLVATDGSGATAVGTLTLTVEPLIRDGQTLIGTRHADTLTGTAYNDVFDGRAGADTLIGLGGDDLYLVTDKKDHIVETANGGFDAVWADTAGYTLPDQVEALALIGGDDYAGSGNGLGNLLVGNRGDNRLDGLAGDDLLRGLAGDDTLLGGAGRDALDGGSGDDVLEDGDDAGFLAGGRGDDRLRLGGGADVIAFNRGDDADRIEGGDGQNDTLSLGGGIRVGDVRLKKTGKDLIVDTGCGDTLRFDDWYQNSGSRSVTTLQVATDVGGTVFERYNFAALVQKFDSVLAANRRIDSWTPGGDASRFKLGDATREVAGGSLATAYASSGALADIRPETVSAALATPRSDATASDSLPDVPLPPQPVYHHDQRDDHNDHGHDGHGHDDRHERDGRFGWQGAQGPFLSQREVEAAWQSWQHPGASPPSASPIDYAMGWARLRDRLAGRFDEGDYGGAWCDRMGGARQEGFSLLSGGQGAFGSGNPIGLSGAGLKPFEGLKEGFERLHGS
ncbi:MAG: putative Ig domain-containing protein [Sulfuritalea sp.]|nr:putative Ig domain-containing protein [Sulfuritalea sp.]